MDTPEDEPQLPPHLHVKLVYYAIAQAKMKLGETPEAQYYTALYEQNLPPPIKGLITIRPTPLGLVPDMGPFDLEWRANRI